MTFIQYIIRLGVALSLGGGLLLAFISYLSIKESRFATMQNKAIKFLIYLGLFIFIFFAYLLGIVK